VSGSQNNYCKYNLEPNSADVVSTQPLGSSRDMSIVALVSRSGLVYPNLFQRSIWFLRANWGYLFALLPLFIIWFFWNRRGRDKRYVSDNVYFKPDNTNAKTVSLFERKFLPTVYHPIDGLSPAEVGTIIDEKVQTHDLIAEIVELARLGFLKIVTISKKEYALVKKNADISSLKDFQQTLYAELFKDEYQEKSKKDYEKLKGKKPDLGGEDFVLVSSLKNKFYEALTRIKKDLYRRMGEEEFFAEDPEKTRIKWLLIYSLIVGVSAFRLFGYVSVSHNFLPILVFVVSSVLGGFFAWFMPRRTPKGYSLFRQIQGLKVYLEKGKWRYEHMEKIGFFEDVLPLAISLQIIDKLAKDMGEIGVKPPKYFEGVSEKTFNLYIGNFYSNTASNLTSTPASTSSSWSGGSGFSGGGSVGGGFGGGGGGSW
jgi:uncharacterized membrane protein